MIKRYLTIAVFVIVSILAISIAVGFLLLNISSGSNYTFLEIVLYCLGWFFFFPTLIIVSYILVYKPHSSLIVYLNKKDICFSVLIALLLNGYICYGIQGVEPGGILNSRGNLSTEIIMLLCFTIDVIYNGIFAAKYNKSLWDAIRVTIVRVQTSMMLTYFIPLYFWSNNFFDSHFSIDIERLCFYGILMIPPIVVINRTMKFEGFKAMRKVKL